MAPLNSSAKGNLLQALEQLDVGRKKRIHRSVIAKVYSKVTNGVEFMDHDLAELWKQFAKVTNTGEDDDTVDYKAFVNWLFLRETKSDGDQYRALSVNFLRDGLRRELDYSKDDTVCKIEEKIREAGGDMLCPRDQKLGAAYVDAADDEFAGKANYMLSYTWGYKVSVIVDALETFCTREKLDPTQVRVWICAFCINQWRVHGKQEPVTFDHFRKTFADKVNTIGNILSLLTPWDNPLYLERVWTLFEFYTGSTNPDKVTVKFIFPQSDEKMFSNTLRNDAASGTLSAVFQIFGNLKVQNANASYEDDKRNVMRCLTDDKLDTTTLEALVADQLTDVQRSYVDLAFKDINEKIVRKLQEWLLGCARDRVTEEVGDCLKGYVGVGLLCNQIGMYTDGVAYIDNGIETAQAFYGVKLSTEELKMREDSAFAFTSLLRMKAKLLTYSGDYKDAYYYYERSSRILERSGLCCTLAYAECQQAMAIWHGRMGDKNASIELTLAAKKSYELVGEQQTSMYANLLKGLGINLFIRGQEKKDSDAVSSAQDIAEADELWQSSENTFKEIKQESNPWYLDLQTWRGCLLSFRGDHEGAAAKIQEAINGLAGLGLQKSPQYDLAIKKMQEVTDLAKKECSG